MKKLIGTILASFLATTAAYADPVDDKLILNEETELVTRTSAPAHVTNKRVFRFAANARTYYMYTCGVNLGMLHIRVCRCLCIYVCIKLCVYIYIYIHIYTHMHVNMYLGMCMQRCTHI